MYSIQSKSSTLLIYFPDELPTKQTRRIPKRDLRTYSASLENVAYTRAKLRLVSSANKNVDWTMSCTSNKAFRPHIFAHPALASVLI